MAKLAGLLGQIGSDLRVRQRLELVDARIGRMAAEAKLASSEQMMRCAALTLPADARKKREAAIAKHNVVSDPEGWRWPVQILAAGQAYGSNAAVGGGTLANLPHFFPQSILPQFAEAANGVRLRRRHPPGESDGADIPELTAGSISDARVSLDAVIATANLLKTETQIRSRLMAAREAGKLDLFGVSIFAYMAYVRSQVDGKPAFVAKRAVRLVGVDMCAEPGAAGWFLA